MRVPKPSPGLRYLLNSQGTSVFVPLDQRDWRLCLDRAADVSVDPDGNVDDGGHVHHAGRIWGSGSSSTALARGKSPSLPHRWASEHLHCFYNQFRTQIPPWLPQAVISRLATAQIHRNTWHFWEALLTPKVVLPGAH